MNKENLVSIQLSNDEISKVNEALKTIQDILKPHLATISTEDRKSLPKMNEKNVPFVKKVLEYAESHPEFAPAYLNIAELKIDVEAFDTLNKFARPMEEIAVALEDTTILCGSEAYIASLAYYQSLRQGVKRDIPGAKVLYEDLKTRFEANGVRNDQLKKE